MKTGMNLLLWTGHVTTEHAGILQAIKDTGFDGVEIPVFDPGDAGHYAGLGRMLDDLGLERTAVALIPDEAHSPISENAAARQAGIDHLNRVIDCCEAVGAQALVGPWYQPLGVFSGDGPTDTELDRWRSYGLEPIIARWLASAHPLGTPLSVGEPGETPLSGTFAGLTGDGALQLRLADGTSRAIHAGEVRLAVPD